MMRVVDDASVDVDDDMNERAQVETSPDQGGKLGVTIFGMCTHRIVSIHRSR
jgi:hypothetical protein